MAKKAKSKADLFRDYVEKNHPNVFQLQTVEDEAHTNVFRSFVEVEGVKLPLAIFIDDSIYTVIRVLLAENVVRENNKVQVHEYVNEQNRAFKVFKYMADQDNSIYMDACVPALEEKFAPELLVVILDVMVRHLIGDGFYQKLMKQVWVTE